MGRGGGEGHVPSLMTAAVKREVSNLISFLSSLMCRPWSIRLKRESNEVDQRKKTAQEGRPERGRRRVSSPGG